MYDDAENWNTLFCTAILFVSIVCYHFVFCCKTPMNERKSKRAAQIPRSFQSNIPESPLKSEEKSGNLESEQVESSEKDNNEGPKKDSLGQIPNELKSTVTISMMSKKDPGPGLAADMMKEPPSAETTEGLAVPIGKSAGAKPKKSSLTDIHSSRKRRSVSFSDHKNSRKSQKKILF